MKTSKPKRAKWYMTYVGECPVCGRYTGYKEAKYTKPPPKYKRYQYMPDTITYDGCNL